MKNKTQIKLNKIQQTKATRVANLFAKRAGENQIQITAITDAKMLKGGRAKDGVYPNALLNADENGNVPTVQLFWNQLADSFLTLLLALNTSNARAKRLPSVNLIPPSRL